MILKQMLQLMTCFIIIYINDILHEYWNPPTQSSWVHVLKRNDLGNRD